MNDVVKYLQECGTFYLATVEGDQPHVRPFVQISAELTVCFTNG